MMPRAMSRPHAPVHAHLLPHVAVRPAGLPAALPRELLVVARTATVHPTAVDASAAHPVCFTVKPTARSRGVGVQRVRRQLDAVVTAAHRDRLVLDRPSGL